MRTRKCFQTGAVLPETALLRFAISEDGQVLPDVYARAPGRGLWLHADADVLGAAISGRSFARAAKRKVQVPPDLQARTGAALAEAALQVLGLARRAGALVCGFEQVHGLLHKAAPACLIEAADGAPDGRRKLLALAQAKWGGVPLVDGFTSAQMGPPVGRAHSTHMAMTNDALAEKLCFHARKLSALRLLFHAQSGDMRC